MAINHKAFSPHGFLTISSSLLLAPSFVRVRIALLVHGFKGKWKGEGSSFTLLEQETTLCTAATDFAQNLQEK